MSPAVAGRLSLPQGVLYAWTNAMFTSRSLSPAFYYLFFSGEREQQQRFFRELHFISIAILTFGLACWLVTFSLTLSRASLDHAQAARWAWRACWWGCC